MTTESIQLQDETRRTPDVIRVVNDGTADFNGGNGSTDRLADLSGEIKGKDLYIAQLQSDYKGLQTEVMIQKTQNALAEEKKKRADETMFKCLEEVKPDTVFDRARDDPVTLLDRACREFLENARGNLAVATKNHQNFELEFRQRQTLDKELTRTKEKLRTAEDSLLPLRCQIDELGEALDKAEITITDLRNEIKQRDIKIAELDKRLDRQRQSSAARQSELQLQHEAQTLTLNKQVRDLQKDLDTQKEDLAQTIKKHLDSYNRDRQKLEDRLAAQQGAFDTAMEEREGELGKLIQQERVVHEKEMEGQRAAHRRELLKQENEHKRNLVDLRATVKNLEGDLVDNSDDFRPASDDALKVRFKDIKLTIETITSPFNIRATTIPEGVDPDGFLVRESKSKLCFLLRSIVWSKLIDGFFSSPFGFGALGTGDGARMLVALYSSWRRLFDAGSFAAPDTYPREQIFERFRTDKEANKWRSSTFQSILMTVHPKGQKKGVSGAEAVRPYADNCNRVQSEILDLFVKVIGRGAAEELEIKVDTIVSLASELALEFGSQRAQLGLQMPNRGESIQMGPDFEDCEDGAGTHGTIEEVDLAISPKLYRIGDGRNDLTTRKTIVAGEIYPLRS
ncbi:hypothetical protein B0T24DRAFT_680020 [Lasiosphaeria ovina]|uniref:Uncharacterized protein n=1 Tax=Lasiosphaeria ovina TaxID=92902 RepID=A0AAE0N5F3_9PEZI|nr:hypothetical protein B0T24DRAFT_680020 [Lasiosphaeria ovina]